MSQACNIQYIITILNKQLIEILLSYIFAFCHYWAVERGKEQILKNQPIVVALIWIEKDLEKGFDYRRITCDKEGDRES